MDTTYIIPWTTHLNDLDMQHRIKNSFQSGMRLSGNLRIPFNILTDTFQFVKKGFIKTNLE